MTVKELIAELKKHDCQLEVTDFFNSPIREVKEAETVKLYNLKRKVLRLQ